MVEVRNEHPSNRIATPSKESHREEERQTIVQQEVAKKVHAEPQASNKGVMLDSAWKPLVVELFVALASGTFVWEIVVPLHCEQAACIVETKEVDNWHESTCENKAKRMDRKRLLSVDPRPL